MIAYCAKCDEQIDLDVEPFHFDECTEEEVKFMRYETTATPEREWSYVDKSEWGHGDWNDEPDKMQWTDEETGLPCLIVRGPSGALCGYAGVPESHPWFGKDYSHCTLPIDCMKDYDSEGDEYRYCAHDPQSRLEAHGGITFASACEPNEDNPEHGICHVIPGDEKVWWFGFDCAHSGDLCPKYGRRDFGGPYDTYKFLRYVKRETTQLAAQLAAVEPPK